MNNQKLNYIHRPPVLFRSTNGTNGERRRGTLDPVDHKDALDSGLLVGLLNGLSMLMLWSRFSSLLSLALDGTEGKLGVPDEATAVTGEGSGL